MSKNKFKKIVDLILGSGLIIKKRIDHDNGDISLRIGKDEIMKTKSKAPDWFSEWATHNEASMNKRFDAIETRLDVIEQDVKVLKQDVTILKQDVTVLKQDVTILKQDVTILKQDVKVLKQDVALMKNTPTMKRELAQL